LREPRENIMAIRHVVTIRVADGGAEGFLDAFKALQELALRDPGCEQYELFRSVDDPDTMVMLELWSSRELLEKHMAAERAGNAALVDAVVALWAPGFTPTVERYET
jgi:quinol monooxygenase YgiN